MDVLVASPNARIGCGQPDKSDCHHRATPWAPPVVASLTVPIATRTAQRLDPQRDQAGSTSVARSKGGRRKADHVPEWGVMSPIVRHVGRETWKEQQMSGIARDQTEPRAESYEPPVLTEIGSLSKITKGQYSRSNSDDGDAGGYWEP